MKTIFRKIILLHTLLLLGVWGAYAQSLPTQGAVTITEHTLFENSITLTGDLSINVKSGVLCVITGNIAGDFNLTKTGAGRLIINGDKTYTGTTTVSNGLLEVLVSPFRSKLMPGTPFNSSSIAVEENATISFNTSASSQGTAFTFANVISGKGNLEKKNTGTLRLTAENTYTGTTTIEDGKLIIGDGVDELHTKSSSFLLSTADATLRLESQKLNVLNSKISGLGNLEVDIPNYLVFNKDVTNAGETTIEGKNVTFDGLAPNNINISENVKLLLAVYNYDGVISGEGEVIFGSLAGSKIGTVTKSQNYTGRTTIAKDRTLILEASGSIANSSQVILQDSAKIDFTGYTAGDEVVLRNLRSTSETAEIIIAENQTLNLHNDKANIKYQGILSGRGNYNFHGDAGSQWTFAGTHTDRGVFNMGYGNLYLAADWMGKFNFSAKEEIGIGKLWVVGERNIEGDFTLEHQPIIHFDLTASEASRLQCDSRMYYAPGTVVDLEVKADLEDTYVLMNTEGLNLNNFELNMIGDWKEGELFKDGNNLKLRPIVTDLDAPVPGNAGELVVGDVTDNSIEVSWTKAEDDVTEQADLAYRVEYGWTNDQFETAWEKDITTILLEELLADTEYTIVVKVRDEAENLAAYEEVKVTTLPAAGLAELQDAGAKIWSSPEGVHFSLQKIEHISVYDIFGVLIHHVQDAVGDIKLPLIQGIYIIKIAGDAVKITIK